MLRKIASICAVGIGATVFTVLPAQATNIGNEGCTPGYWKQTQHFDSYEEYTPDEAIYWVFRHNHVSAFDGLPADLAAYGNLSMVDALKLKGGPGVTGATEILLRAATAAFLNAASEQIGYPMRRYNDPGNMGYRISDALHSGDRDQIIALASELDKANNLGCPIS
jgi:hypothetical protein